MMIPTAIGPVDREDLVVTFEITEEEHNFIIHCIWKKDDQLVRKDVWVNAKHGLDLGLGQGQIGG